MVQTPPTTIRMRNALVGMVRKDGVMKRKSSGTKFKDDRSREVMRVILSLPTP